MLPERLLRYTRTGLVSVGGFEVESPNPRKGKRWPLYCFEPLDVEALNDAPYEEELDQGFVSRRRTAVVWIAASDVRVEDSPVLFLTTTRWRHGEKCGKPGRILGGHDRMN